ncbi:MAG TPA: NAD(P)/FAD-dependent oxidoreductase, partial [Blastocatellia bacterium]|nr:NAD(P)/FAD-dependent oxidoreductase [Blastocatellia bacterium]
MSESFDAVIIGAGHNGLVTACYLARAGLKVCVLERREIVGGACVTEEVFPGCKVSPLSYLCSLLQPRIIQELELEKYGFHIYPKDPPFFTAFPDGQHLFFWQDTNKTIAELSRFSRKDAEAYPRYAATVERLCEQLEAILLKTPGDQDFVVPDELARFIKLSAREFLEEWFESDEIKATLSTDGIIGYNGGPSTAGTAYNMLHHLMGMAAGQRGLWSFVRGGMGTITKALAQSAQVHGAKIRTGVEVSEVLIKDGAAYGIALTDGEEIYSKFVISNADPKRTFLELVPPWQLEDDFRTAIENFSCEGTAVKINLLLDGLPNFKAYPTSGSTPDLPHRSTMHILHSMDYLDRAWGEASNGYPSTNPMLELGIPTAYDDSLAPQGKHLMSIFAQYAPYKLKDGIWDQATKDRFADRCL